MNSPKDKMISGQPYVENDGVLFKERQFVRSQLFQLNQIDPTRVKARNQIFKNILGKISGRFFIEPPFYCDYGYNIEVGENFYANFNLTILDSAKVVIGNNVMIGPNVGIYSSSHPINHELRIAGIKFARTITIGHNVWIGGNSTINPGIQIGDNVIIGSGSVVTKDIPPNMIAAGNPCQVIREIKESDKEFYFKNLLYTEDLK